MMSVWVQVFVDAATVHEWIDRLERCYQCITAYAARAFPIVVIQIEHRLPRRLLHFVADLFSGLRKPLVKVFHCELRYVRTDPLRMHTPAQNQRTISPKCMMQPTKPMTKIALRA